MFFNLDPRKQRQKYLHYCFFFVRFVLTFNVSDINSLIVLLISLKLNLNVSQVQFPSALGRKVEHINLNGKSKSEENGINLSNLKTGNNLQNGNSLQNGNNLQNGKSFPEESMDVDIAKVKTSQTCNFPSGNFPKVRLVLLRLNILQWGGASAAARIG